MSKALELIHLKCRPHYLPREINVVNLFAVYNPPDADTTATIDEVENFVELCNINLPHSAIIIVGDFNKAKLSNGMTQ